MIQIMCHSERNKESQNRTIMIYNHTKNIGSYKGSTPAMDAALDYITRVTPEVDNGLYFMENGVEVMVKILVK